MNKNRRAARPVARAALSVAIIGTAFIAAGAFWLSFAALADLAGRAGVPSGQTWVWPLVVDGLIVVSTVAVFALRGYARTLTAYPWALLAGGVVVSVAANGVHAALNITDVPTAVAVIVASVPPVALVASTHLSALLLDYAAPGATSGTGLLRPRRPAQAATPAQAGAPQWSTTEPAPAFAPQRPEQPGASERPTVTEDQARAWFEEQLAAGVEPTGAAFAKAFDVSPATGRRRVAQLREAQLDQVPATV